MRINLETFVTLISLTSLHDTFLFIKSSCYVVFPILKRIGWIPCNRQEDSKTTCSIDQLEASLDLQNKKEGRVATHSRLLSIEKEQSAFSAVQSSIYPTIRLRAQSCEFTEASAATLAATQSMRSSNAAAGAEVSSNFEPLPTPQPIHHAVSRDAIAKEFRFLCRSFAAVVVVSKHAGSMPVASWSLGRKTVLQ